MWSARGLFRKQPARAGRAGQPARPPAQRIDPYVTISAVRGGIAQPVPPDEQVRQQALREAFTPTRPQRSFRRVAGRKPEMLRILRAIGQERAHVVLFGERGRGKTSLVNLVSAAARAAGYMVGRYTCAWDSDFDQIIRGLARDLPRSMLAIPAVESEVLEGCEAGLPQGTLQPRDVAVFPGRLAGRHLLLIVDEFDRVADSATRTRFADTIKQVSDRGAAVSFIIIGVSDSLEELIGRHPSIQRNVIGVPAALLSEPEVQEILDHGSRDAQIDFPPAIRSAISHYAQGLPYIVQLLGLYCGDKALSRGGRTVSQADLMAAIRRAVDEIDPHVAVRYEGLTRGGRDWEMEHALCGIAGGRLDRFGRFLVLEEEGNVWVAGQPVSSTLWARLTESGAVRSCPSAGFGLYCFTEPMLCNYTLLREALASAPQPTAMAQGEQAL
ncbi:MAG TPA: ATP-binding protein [Acetobacteraceae bacterium]|jgi:hypothetical protein